MYGRQLAVFCSKGTKFHVRLTIFPNFIARNAWGVLWRYLASGQTVSRLGVTDRHDSKRLFMARRDRRACYDRCCPQKASVLAQRGYPGGETCSEAGALEPRPRLTRVLRKHSLSMDAADWLAEVSQINIGRDAPGLIVYHH